MILGEEFMRYGVPSEKGISELLSKMTSAMAGKTSGETGEDEEETGEQKSLNKDKAPDTVEEAMTMSVKELKAAVRYALLHVFIHCLVVEYYFLLHVTLLSHTCTHTHTHIYIYIYMHTYMLEHTQ